MANLLQAIHRIINNPILDVKSYNTGNNRANSVGDALENYVKDAFANTFSEENDAVRDRVYGATFSYLGNTTNPPDIILKDGDAIETKKIESENAVLPLNSSYPKAKLHSDSTLLTKACRECEEWKVKDIIYAIGHTKVSSLKYLWLIYGDCFAASRDVYERTWKDVSNGIGEIQDIEFSPTEELGRVNKVDPLGITYLRI